MTAPTADITEAIGAAMPEMDDDERRLAAAIYRALLRGDEPRPQDLAEQAGLDPAVVEARLETWPGVFRDGERVIGFWGLTTQAISPHVVQWNGATTYAWCALDPLFILPTLGETARVESTCPTTGARVTLTVGPDGARDADPVTPVMSVLVPDGPFDSDVIQSFCHFVHFFADDAAARAWSGDHEHTMHVSLADAEAIGATLAGRVFGA